MDQFIEQILRRIDAQDRYIQKVQERHMQEINYELYCNQQAVENRIHNMQIENDNNFA